MVWGKTLTVLRKIGTDGKFQLVLTCPPKDFLRGGHIRARASRVIEKLGGKGFAFLRASRGLLMRLKYADEMG